MSPRFSYTLCRVVHSATHSILFVIYVHARVCVPTCVWVGVGSSTAKKRSEVHPGIDRIQRWEGKEMIHGQDNLVKKGISESEATMRT